MYKEFRETKVDSNMRLVDAVHRNTKIVVSICEHINKLSYLFSRMGNDKIGQELEEMIFPLLQSAHQVDKSFGKQLS